MKKIIAIMLVLAAVVSLASCKVNGGKGETEPYNPEEYVSNLAAAEEEQSKAAAEKAEKESKIQEEIDDYIRKVGKTKKKTQLCLRLNTPDYIGKEYWRFEFKANGEYKTKIEYHFLATSEQYHAKLQLAKDMDGMKVIEKDADLNLVVIRNDRFVGKSFDAMYSNFTHENMKEMGYFVIE